MNNNHVLVETALYWWSDTNFAFDSIETLVNDYYQQLETASEGEQFLIRIALHHLGVESNNVGLNDTIRTAVRVIRELDIINTAEFPRDFVEMGKKFILSCHALSAHEQRIIKAAIFHQWDWALLGTAQSLLKKCVGVYDSYKEFVKSMVKLPQGIVIDYQRSIDMLKYKYTFVEYSGMIYVFDCPFINLPMPDID